MSNGTCLQNTCLSRRQRFPTKWKSAMPGQSHRNRAGTLARRRKAPRPGHRPTRCRDTGQSHTAWTPLESHTGTQAGTLAGPRRDTAGTPAGAPAGTQSGHRGIGPGHRPEHTRGQTGGRRRSQKCVRRKHRPPTTTCTTSHARHVRHKHAQCFPKSADQLRTHSPTSDLLDSRVPSSRGGHADIFRLVPMISGRPSDQIGTI